MDTLVQQTVNGLMLGSIYALIALGYTMVYGILRIINFAHGDVLMVGALSALSAIGVLQHHFPTLSPYVTLLLAALIAMAVCSLVSMSIERLAYRRLRNAPRLAPLISGIGVSLLLQTLAMLIWSRNPLMFPQLLPMEPIALTSGSANHAPAVITGTGIATLAIALLVMAGLLLLVEHSRFGRAMRATAENPQVAGLMGIDPNRIIVLTFALGGALAAGHHDGQQLRQCRILHGVPAGHQSLHRRRIGRYRQPARRHARRPVAGVVRVAGHRLSRRTDRGHLRQ